VHLWPLETVARLALSHLQVECPRITGDRARHDKTPMQFGNQYCRSILSAAASKSDDTAVLATLAPDDNVG
jgi:hypothetical protein